MLENSIIGKLYIYWQYSFFYSVLEKIYRFLKNSFQYGFFHGILTCENKMEAYCEFSLIIRFADGVIDFLLKIISGAAGFLTPAWKSSRLVKTALNSVFLKFDFILCAWIVVMYAVPHSMWTNTYAVLSAFGLLALYFILAGCGKRTLVKPKDFGVSICIFVIVTLTSNLFTTERGDSIRTTLFFLTAFIFMWIIRSETDSSIRLDKILLAIYIAVIFTALFAIGQRLAGIEVNPVFIDAELNPGIPARVYSTVDNPNNYAELIVLFSPLACVYAMNRKNMLSRFILCCCMGFPMIALLMTYSRSGWLSIALCVFIFVYYTNKKLIPWIFVAGILCIPFLPASILTRLGNIVNSSDKSASFRLTLWESCIKLLSMGNRWLTGIGLGAKTYKHHLLLVTTEHIANSMAHTQMLYIELFMEWGVMGFISFMCFICSKIKAGACAVFKTGDRLISGTLIACLSALLGIAVLAVFEYIWFYPRILFAYFIVTGIMLACVDITRKNNG